MGSLHGDLRVWTQYPLSWRPYWQNPGWIPKPWPNGIGRQTKPTENTDLHYDSPAKLFKKMYLIEGLPRWLTVKPALQEAQIQFLG